jgi:hypothetical protein
VSEQRERTRVVRDGEAVSSSRKSEAPSNDSEPRAIEATASPRDVRAGLRPARSSRDSRGLSAALTISTAENCLSEHYREQDTVLLTNNAKDFESLHAEYDHAGILLYYDQNLPDTDPEGLARTVAEVFEQHDTAGIENRLVDLGEWYEWLQD